MFVSYWRFFHDTEKKVSLICKLFRFHFFKSRFIVGRTCDRIVGLLTVACDVVRLKLNAFWAQAIPGAGWFEV